MGRDLKELFREAAQLSDEDRAALAGLLLESIEPGPEPEVEAAWAAEIERRMAEIDSGAVQMIPWEEVRKELFRRRE
jgi:putative addiction module component (TIGR02574 family)